MGSHGTVAGVQDKYNWDGFKVSVGPNVSKSFRFLLFFPDFHVSETSEISAFSGFSLCLQIFAYILGCNVEYIVFSIIRDVKSCYDFNKYHACILVVFSLHSLIKMSQSTSGNYSLHGKSN